MADLTAGADENELGHSRPLQQTAVTRSVIRSRQLKHWRRITDNAIIAAAATDHPEVQQQSFAGVLHRIHPSHQLYSVRNILFCDHCGYWSEKRYRCLSTECNGSVLPGQRTIIRHLRKGRHPDRRFWPDGESGTFPVQRVQRMPVEQEADSAPTSFSGPA